MNVRFSARAKERARVVATWWRANRPAAPTLFEEELRDAVEQLTLQPTLGLEYERIGNKLVRRILLPRTAQHIYYVIDDVRDLVVIHTIWGARRGRGPKL